MQTGTTAQHLFRIADRLAEVVSGSEAADQAIHRALGLAGDPPPYTRDEVALRALLPAGYEVEILTTSTAGCYAACKRSAEADYPHHGQWGRTATLASCGAIMRTYAALAKAIPSPPA